MACGALSFINVPTCSEETFALIYILKAGGECFCRTSAEWPLWRCTVDVTARGANGGGCDTGQGALVSTCLDRKQLFNDAVSSSDCAVSIKGLLVNSELLATGGRGLLELISRN